MSLTSEIAMDVILNVNNASRTIADIEDAVGTGVDKGLTGTLKKNQTKITKSYADALIGALRLSRVEQAKNLEHEFKQRSKKIEDESKTIQLLEAKATKKKYANIKKHIEEEIVKRKGIIKMEQKAIAERIDEQAEAQASQLELLETGMKKAAKGYGQQMEDVADNFQNALGKALSAENLDLGDLTKGLGKAFAENAGSMTSGGANLMAQGGKMGGGGGKMLAFLGKGIMKLGAAAGVIAGVAAVVGGLIAVLMAAYGQTKQFNKAILEGSSALDLLSSDAVGSSTALTQSLAEIRQSAMYLAYDFRTTTEEVLSLSTAMNETGLTFKEQVGVWGHTGRAMKQALVASQAFGVGAGEVAGMMNMMTRDFAMGQHAIADAFGDIFGAAQMSGMGVKSFFTAVSEATSGMALYNFRLEDTLELMVGLEKILGEEMGKEVLGQLKGKYKDMGFQERYQKTVVAGGAGRAVIGASAKRQAEGLMGSILESDKARELVSKGGFSKEGLMKEGRLSLGGLKGQELGALQNAFKEAGLEEIAVKISSLAQLQRGAGPGASLGQRAGALGELDQSGTLAFDMVSAFAVLGDKGLGDMEGIDRMTFEQTTGISGNMFEAYQDISNRLGAQLTAEKKGTGVGGKATLTDIATAIAESDLLSEKDKAMLEEAMKEGGSEMEKVARNQLKETQSILQTLKNGVVMVLETIYMMMDSSPFFGRYGGGPNIREARQKKEAAEKELFEFDPEKFTPKEDATIKQNREEELKVEERNAKEKKRLEDRVAYQQLQYTGALEGKTREETLEGLAGGRAGELGISYERRKSDVMFGDPWETVTIDPEDITDEQIAALVAQGKQREKEAKEQVDATKAGNKAQKDAMQSQFALEQLIQHGLTEDSTAEDIQAKIKSYEDKGEDVPGSLKWILEQKQEDFIYRGNARTGIITPIDSQDSFFGAKPGGALSKMGMGGTVINNLTINESGDPQKTLQMVKQAIAAARK